MKPSRRILVLAAAAAALVLAPAGRAADDAPPDGEPPPEKPIAPPDLIEPAPPAPPRDPLPAPPLSDEKRKEAEQAWKTQFEAGIQALANKKYPEAERRLTTALRIADEKGLGDILLAMTYGRLGDGYTAENRLPEAADRYEKALAHIVKARGPDTVDAINGRINLAAFYAAQRLYDKAEFHGRQVVEYLRKQLEGKAVEDPNVAQTAMAQMDQLGTFQEMLGKAEEAEKLYKEALDLADRLSLPVKSKADGHSFLGRFYLGQKRHAEAVAQYEGIRDLWQKALGSDHPTVADAYNNLAHAYQNQGHQDKAEAAYVESIRIFEKKKDSQGADVATVYGNLGALYMDQNRNPEAEKLYEQALEIREKALGGRHALVAQTHHRLGEVRLALGKLEEAEKNLEKALAIYKAVIPNPNHPFLAATLYSQARLQKAQAKPAEAEPTLRRAVDIMERVFRKDHPELVKYLKELADVLRKNGKEAEAVEFEKRVKQIEEK